MKRKKRGLKKVEKRFGKKKKVRRKKQKVFCIPWPNKFAERLQTKFFFFLGNNLCSVRLQKFNKSEGPFFLLLYGCFASSRRLSSWHFLPPKGNFLSVVF